MKILMGYNGTPDGLRSRDKTRLRWMGSVRMDLKKSGLNNWREKAGNREDSKRAMNDVNTRIRLKTK